MTAIKKVITKNGKVQYYEFNMMQIRSFRISAAAAELQLATGESYLVERFITDRAPYESNKPVEIIESSPVTPLQTESNSNNVISFTDRLKVKQDQSNMEKAKTHFVNNILPNMTIEEKHTILNNPSMIQDILLNVMIRTTVQSI